MKYLIIYENYDNHNFFGKIGAGILPFCITTKRFLVALRSEYVDIPNRWNLWGGKVNYEENVEIAAKREFEEESGYNGDIELI
ncbi:NUDIX domain-containing protein, partial [bacterium]|nr:NUDIX domain-containing protein [bacterium]